MAIDVQLSAPATVAVTLATQGPLDVNLLPDHRLGQHTDFDDSNIVTGNVLTRQSDGTFAMQGVPGGVSTFLGLDDTPASYAGAAQQVVRVNAGATALEFAAVGAGDMTIAVYDPAGVAEQLVGLTAVQTITGKSIVATQIDSGTLPDARIQVTGVTQHQASIDHDLLLNFAAGEHFTEASIDHVNILNIGSNSHATIDSHIAATVAHGATGAVVGTTNTQALTNKTLDDFSNSVHADTLHVEMRNESGGAMAVGDVVYISGYSVGQNLALASLADSSVAGTMPASAILDSATLANNANGQFTEAGRVINMDTSAWSVGDDIYVSAVGTTGNTLTNVKPTGANLIQKVGLVLRSHATLGVLEFFGAGRANDLPNIPTDNLWVGNGSAVPTATGSTGSGLVVRQTSPTINTPTIPATEWTNAGHTHAGASTGGQIAIADTTGTLAIARGGTGQTTQTEAFDALAPTTTAGDTIYRAASDNVRLAAGTARQLLRMNSAATAPEWFRDFKKFGITIDAPVSGDIFGIFIPDVAITVQELIGICDNGTSVVCNVRRHTSIAAAGGTLIDQFTPTAAVTSGGAVAAAAVPADTIVFLELGTVTGSVDSVTVTGYYTED